jgi:hypothetical protein
VSVSYKPVIWNRTKMIYDGVLLAVIAAGVIYLALGNDPFPNIENGPAPVSRERPKDMPLCEDAMPGQALSAEGKCWDGPAK